MFYQSKRIALISLLLVCSALPAMAAENSLFNYQGRVLVQKFPYTGIGKMKVAVLATTSTGAIISLWSNDGTSIGGSEPIASFPVAVTDGIFDIMIGDERLGMSAIPSIMFNRDDELIVRVWFDDGRHGFQSLYPDRRLTHPRRFGLTELKNEAHLYVDSTTGNDQNSGLSASTAKRSIQAAVDMVPGRLFNNLTIHLASGIYRETATISGVSATRNKYLIIEGDPNTIPSDALNPSVRITGANNDSTHNKVRTSGLEIINSHGVKIAGILFDYFASEGIYTNASNTAVDRCKATHCTEAGFNEFYGTNSSYTNCIGTYNGYAGFEFKSTNALLTYCTASHNDNGVVGTNANVVIMGGAVASNIWQGCKFWSKSQLTFGLPGVSISGNNSYGVELYYNSSVQWYSYANFSSNGKGNILSTAGSGYY